MVQLFRRAAGYQGDALNLPVPNVDDAIPCYEELTSRGLEVSAPEVQRSKRGAWRAFFVVAPDGLCYMLGEPVP